MYVPHSLLLWAQRTPDAEAIRDAQGRHSYAQLLAAAQEIAARLRALVPHGGPLAHHVAVCCPKSALAVAGLYGVLLAGGSYVPIEPSLPAERKRHILEQTGALCVLVEAGQGDTSMQGVETALPRLGLDASLWSAPAQVRGPVVNGLHDDSPAAVLFTSGSTGLPKGAVITHGNLRAFVDWAAAAFGLHAGDRLASHASLSFDLSFFDLYAASAVGAGVALVPAAAVGHGALLLQFLREQRPTVWQSVPSTLGLMQEHAGEQGPVEHALRLVLFAGERMPVPRLKKLIEQFPGVAFYNVYGCTETNDSFMYRVPADPDAVPDPLPIGRVLPHITHRILDEAGAPVALGTPGQLWIAGATVMAGYLDAAQNAQVFRELPDAQGVLRRFYWSRDQVVEHDDGDLRFIGRVDGVVKVGGYRISLHEVEDRIAEHGAVDEVAVLAVPDERLGHRMVAVVRPGPGARLNTLEMKLHCSQRLARYMVPQSFLFSPQALPKSSNGKVDRKRLAADFSLHPALQGQPS